MCEQTAKRIPAARLKAVPWTRFREEVEARLESTGEITPPHLGTLRSVRDEPAAALAESRTAGGRNRNLSRQPNNPPKHNAPTFTEPRNQPGAA